MSHIAEISLDIKDLDALEAASKRLGMELARDQKSYRWYGRSVGDYPLPTGFAEADLGKCDHALKVTGKPRAYEIGIVKRRDGRPGWQLLWDFWSGGFGLQDCVGENADRLKQGYATEVTRKYWKRKGYKVSESKREDGTVILRAVR